MASDAAAVKTTTLAAFGAAIAAGWAGAMTGIGLVAAPVVFDVLPRVDAGRVAARLFGAEATIGLCVGAVLMVIGVQLGRERAELGRGSRFGRELVLALCALACVIVGYYALQPLLEPARAGHGPLSFAALHGFASLLFVARIVLAALLAWQLGRSSINRPAIS
ncbi:MAG TPA: DUF4149 domain-containing protein [Caldimonas sp.]|nr:DUF4149 domain-containing protein [Caldimonas sp.]